MTNEEAMEMLTRLRDYEFVYREDAMESHRMACDALEKQIPKNQDKHFIENKFGFFCCKETGKTIRYPIVSFTDLEFCPRCGQAIDWSDENDKR